MTRFYFINLINANHIIKKYRIRKWIVRANIRSTNYNEMQKNAKEIRAKGVEFNKIMLNVYTEVGNLNKSCYGERYNKLVTLFNNLSTNVNKIVLIVVEKMPSALENAANNYANVDSGSKISRVHSTMSYSKMPTIAQSSQKEMRFITADVNTAKTKIEKMLDEMTTKMSEIETIFKRLNWQNGATTSIKSSFSELKNKIVSSINEIKHTFDKLVSEATEETEKAENANTVTKTKKLLELQ